MKAENFNEYLRCNCTVAQMEKIKSVLGTGKRYHFLVRDWGHSTLTELLLISQSLNLMALDILTDYGVGSYTVTEPEIQLLAYQLQHQIQLQQDEQTLPPLPRLGKDFQPVPCPS